MTPLIRNLLMVGLIIGSILWGVLAGIVSSIVIAREAYAAVMLKVTFVEPLPTLRCPIIITEQQQTLRARVRNTADSPRNYNFSAYAYEGYGAWESESICSETYIISSGEAATLTCSIDRQALTEASDGSGAWYIGANAIRQAPDGTGNEVQEHAMCYARTPQSFLSDFLISAAITLTALILAAFAGVLWRYTRIPGRILIFILSLIPMWICLSLFVSFWLRLGPLFLYYPAMLILIALTVTLAALAARLLPPLKLPSDPTPQT